MDPVNQWQAAYDRVRLVVADLDDERLATTVPACPDWSVRDLLSHMVGLGADVLAGNEPEDHDPAWTAAHVTARRDHGADELLAEWAEVARPLMALMREHDSRPLNDIVIHEQDLRGALGLPGGRDSKGIAIVRDRMAARFGRTINGLPPIALVQNDGPTDSGWVWVSHGDTADDGATGARVVVRASGFDLSRALTSRRTADQLRGWATRGDVGPYLEAFALLGDLPEEPLAGEGS
ncbi:maleylpyruvate isomerase family mycothiol-dependent enzyme [Lapillicoccus sp.]|uniref:maleylpyruvate isomerase family mycothiol-dependent enzyme n=1 Tax=Lapillicoccus sp. TaxID=1909287 RepID=UPI0025CCDD13|nr:maleylpyruvate isomerase family mycothiol-dependent enzyme [Lapillicoccus sp.]